jgi:hypothetical protein
MRARALIAIAAAGAFAGFVLIQLGSAIKERQFDSDSQYLILLAADLLRGGSLADWSLAPHFYLFPDGPFVVLIVAAQRLGVTPFLASVALCGAAWIATAALLWRHATGDTPMRALAWGGIVTGLVFALPYLARGPEAILGTLLVPALHRGTMMVAALCFLATCRLLSASAWRRREFLWLAALTLAVGATTFSDLLFVAWGVGPLLTVVASQARRAIWWRLVAIAGPMLIAMVVGYLLSRWAGGMISENYNWATVVQSWWKSAREALDYFRQAAFFCASPLRSAIFYANLVLVAAACYAFIRELGRGPSSPRRLILLFFGAASAASIVTTVGIGIFRLPAIRMFLPYLLWGEVALIAVLAWPRRRSDTALAAGLLLVLGSGFWLDAQARPHRGETVAACLSAKGLVSGAASYWDALPVMVAARGRIHVVSLAPYRRDQFVPFDWMIKRDWLTHRAADGGPAILQFVIVGDNGPDQAEVTRALGAPSGSFACADRTVLLFDPPRPNPGAGK